MRDIRWFYDEQGVKWTSYLVTDDVEDQASGRRERRTYVRFDSAEESRRRDDPESVTAWRGCTALELEWMLGAAEPIPS
jgi:hypothetical protein